MSSRAPTDAPDATVDAEPDVAGVGEGAPPSVVRTALFGFAMGSADLVPGVSGGTVALVAGIYERLVGNIRVGAGIASDLLRGRLGEVRDGLRTIEWRFLLALFGGILTAVAVLAGLLHDALDNHPVAMSGLFFGLIVGSVGVAAQEVRKRDATEVAVGLAAAVVTFLVLGLRSGRFEDPGLAVLFGGGALAVTAMILPGISGSFILLLLGLYESVIGAVDERDLVTVAVVGAGAVVGLGAFSTVLNWLLTRYRDRMLAILIGLMAGSLRVLWPWPTGADGVGDTRLGPPGEDLGAAVALAAVGLAVVVAFGVWGRRKDALGAA